MSLPSCPWDEVLTNCLQDLKLKYYDLMIQHALHQTAYLDAANYYYKVWETPSIKEDVNDKGKTVRTSPYVNYFCLTRC